MTPTAAATDYQLNSPGVITLDNLSVTFGGRPILKALNGELRGRSIGLLGPNGAGKTTLIHTLLGFHAPSAGTARIFGSDIRGDANQIKRLIGYMPERDSFISKMSCIHFVRFMAELSGLPPGAALERAHEALFFVGLGEARYRNVDTFSLGMKQLAKLAQAIVHGPKLIFLDEPTNGLDPPARRRMIRLIHEMIDSGTMHVLLCSHLLGDVEETCEEVLILKQGRIVHHSNLAEERLANKRFVEIETAGDPNGFGEMLAGLGCPCVVDVKGRFKLELPADFDMRRIYRFAADRDLQLRRVSYRQDTLEEIFLKAMET